MKQFNIPFIGLILSFLAFTACEYDGIDPITAVDPGPDAGDPAITISYPTEGTTIKVKEPVTSINIKFEVVDDIEIANIDVSVDGSQIANFSEFTDYRIVKEEVPFNDVTSGEHTLTITATDIAGNTTTKNVNFSKEPPYTPRFANEYLYMPFEGDFTELITVTNAEQVGTPGFTEDAFSGTKAYLGAPNSYITLPFDGTIGESFTVAFWYNVSNNPEAAGILSAGFTDENSENRNQGFRLFREKSGEEQLFKLNVGTGTGESWNEGATLDPVSGEYVHVAFTITPSETILYFNGVPVNTSTMSGPIDWTGVEELAIGSGGETFSYWGHTYDSSPMDELRMFDTALTQSEIQDLIDASAETLYMPFDGDYKDLIANREVTVVGNPGFTNESIAGSAAYQGATASYLTLPTQGLLSNEISATFWYKVNNEPVAAGILVVGPEDTENADFPGTQNKRTSGFRLFREGGDSQQIKLNVGTGDGESWNDGGFIDATAGDWVHIGITISATENRIYINGELARESAFAAGQTIDWTGTDLLSVMSGAPRFTEWEHLSDTSVMDELKFYNKALTQEEIQAAMAQ